MHLQIPDIPESAYCALSADEKAAYLRQLQNIVSYIPYKKKTYDYNEAEQRELKKNTENNLIYRPEYYPEQEAAYRLGGLLSGISCEIEQPKQAIYYFSLAGRNPKAYFAMGILLYRTPQTRSRAVHFFEKAGRLGEKKAAQNALWLLSQDPLQQTRYQQFSKFYQQYYIRKRR